jgi:hypothetical protein
MSRENKPESVTEKRSEYAFWAIPGSAAGVTYSLTLFHEIDFAVNEGYRKIPHGGIEEGGLLFGIIDEKGTRIEAFRPIVCEHSSGPSFLLSDHDLDVLHAQIEGAAADPELEGLHVVGWFLAHTRSPLTLTDREVELCDHYFNHPGMITVLVKPERFQPTRFGFLVRGANGSLSRDGVANAIILPLPGRNAKGSSGPMASIPAPTTTTAAAKRTAEIPSAPSPVSEAAAPVVERTQPPASAVPATQPMNRSARRQRRLSVEQVVPKQEADADSAQAKENESHDVAAALPGGGPGGELIPTRRRGVAAKASDRSLMLRPLPQEENTPDAYRQMELLTQKKPASSTARMVLVLPLAALLGCLVGWVLFLQVPPPIIPLMVKARGENVIVTWPAEQTRSAIYAAVRVDDSTPVPLTPEEKSTGRVEVQARPDMKVELIARNWIRDSRGIVHYVKPVANTAP